MTVRSPAVIAAPVAVTRSAVAGLRSTASVEPIARLSAPLTGNVAIEPKVAPGVTVAPDCAVSAPTVPVPASEVPVCSVTAELASEPVTFRRPTVTVVGPVTVLAEAMTSTPTPCLVIEPVPETTWFKAASVSWLKTSAALLRIPPDPSVATLPTSVPAVIVVPPVKVLAPASVSVPSPSLVMRPLPPTTLLNVKALAAVLIAPAPAKLIRLAIARLLALASNVPLFTVIVPEPSDVVLAKPSVPALRIVPPV